MLLFEKTAKDLQVNVIPSQLRALLASPTAPANKCSRNDGKPKLWTASRRSSRFSPPDGYPLSSAGTSTLLRNHLPPRTAPERLEFPLERPFPIAKHQQQYDTRLPQVRCGPCLRQHPQSRCRSDLVSGFATFRTLTHLHRRIRFTHVMLRRLPMAAFRPCRCQQRPCQSELLPPDQGVRQRTPHHAGHTIE